MGDRAQPETALTTRVPRGLVVGADGDGRPGLVVQRRRGWRMFTLGATAVVLATAALNLTVLMAVALLPTLLRGGGEPLVLDTSTLTIGDRTIRYDQLVGARVVGTLNREVHVTQKEGGEVRVFAGSAAECAWVAQAVEAALRGELSMPLPVMRALPERS